jgi:hypothetical protein
VSKGPAIWKPTSEIKVAASEIKSIKDRLGVKVSSPPSDRIKNSTIKFDRITGKKFF